MSAVSRPHTSSTQPVPSPFMSHDRVWARSLGQQDHRFLGLGTAELYLKSRQHQATRETHEPGHGAGGTYQGSRATQSMEQEHPPGSQANTWHGAGGTHQESRMTKGCRVGGASTPQGEPGGRWTATCQAAMVTQGCRVRGRDTHPPGSQGDPGVRERHSSLVFKKENLTQNFCQKQQKIVLLPPAPSSPARSVTLGT